MEIKMKINTCLMCCCVWHSLYRPFIQSASERRLGPSILTCRREYELLDAQAIAWPSSHLHRQI